jgi:hypothetical protein
MPKADSENLIKIDQILEWSWLLRLRDKKGWRATFYTTGMEHSPTSATGTDGSARRGARRSGRHGRRSGA